MCPVDGAAELQLPYHPRRLHVLQDVTVRHYKEFTVLHCLIKVRLETGIMMLHVPS